MIAWSIRAAIRSNVFTRVFVSTEDPEIAEVSQQFAYLSLQRPLSLPILISSTSSEVIAHALSALPESIDVQNSMLVAAYITFKR